MTDAFDAEPLGFRLRPVRPEDAETVYTIYAATRQSELAQCGWTPHQQESFLRMQCQAQTSHYRLHYPDAHFDLIEWRQQTIGRLIIRYSNTAISLIDIALLPNYRERGFGGSLLQGLIRHADKLNLPISLQVVGSNPAIRLYQRLGFKFLPNQTDSVYLAMEQRRNEFQLNIA